MNIQGFKYSTEAEAQEAIEDINEHYNIPISAEATTRTWTDYKIEGDFFYIASHSSIDAVLGTPETITITEILPE